jgi:hypothetical protein
VEEGLVRITGDDLVIDFLKVSILDCHFYISPLRVLIVNVFNGIKDSKALTQNEKMSQKSSKTYIFVS